MLRLLRPGPRPGRVGYGAVAEAGLGLAATYSGAGHAAAGGSAVAMASHGVHPLVMSVWAGGLVVLAACVLRPRATLAVRFALPRFSRLAVGSMALLAGTGTLQAWREVGSLSGLVDTAYRHHAARAAGPGDGRGLFDGRMAPPRQPPRLAAGPAPLDVR